MQNQFCSYNLPLFDDDKTMYFNDTILREYLSNQNINISMVISEFKKKEDTYPSYTVLPLNLRLGLDSEHDIKWNICTEFLEIYLKSLDFEQCYEMC